MRIAFCVAKQTMADIWKDCLKDADHQEQVILDEESLFTYLSEFSEEVNLILLEDIWATKNGEELPDLIIALKGWYPNIDIMVLSQLPTFDMGKNLLSLGVKGYGNARMLSVHLQDALSCIQGGDTWVYPEFVQMMIKTINAPQMEQKEKLEVLSPREKEIADLVYQGLTNRQISDSLNITLRTVKAHTASIYEKLGVKDRIALVLTLKSR